LIAVPGLLPAVSNAQLAGAAAQPQQIGGPWGLRLATQLEEHPLVPGHRPAIFVLGDRASGTSGQDMAAKGAAEIRRNVSVIKADALHYDQDTDMADAYGTVRVINNGVSFVGPEAHLKVEVVQGYMPTPKYRFNATGGSGSAKEVQLLDNERSIFQDATYTACQCAKPAWYLKGSEFEFDTGADEGVAHNAVLFFQGVPIFASPWLSFPLSDARSSGLLPPSWSTGGSNGFELSLPYYFNIAPNRDLTLTPTFISKRGFETDAQFRYLSPTYSGSISGVFLPNDQITKTNRYSISINHNQNFGNGFGGYVYYNRVSDNTFPEDLGSSTAQIINGTQLLYQQEAGLTYNNGPWSVLTRVQDWQTLYPSTAPYGREPELNVKYRKYNVGGFDFGAAADYTRFTITSQNTTQGDRFTFDPYVSYSLVGPGYFMTPKVQWHFASYQLNTIGLSQTGTPAPAGQPRNFTEQVPTLSLDTGLIFERPVRIFGTNYTQTLEPRLYYVYTPYHNQDFAPLFDTVDADFGLAEIFTPNTFVGGDRVADANRITAALTTRFINPSNGDERARFVIAQQYYFRDQRVTLLPGETPTQATRSDLIAGASIKLGDVFSSETAVQYNADNNQLRQAVAGFAFSPATGKVLNFAYRYTRADTTLDYTPVRQITVSAQWPLTHHFFGVARINYDLAGHSVVDSLVGLQYDADCWVLGVGVQRYANGVSSKGVPTQGTKYLMQLTLKGLSNIDNGLMQSFRAAVPGYTPLPPPPPPEARFTNYE
jgi:LPS-assembly protein